MNIAILADFNLTIQKEGSGLTGDFIQQFTEEMRGEDHRVQLFAHPDSQLSFAFHSYNSGAIDWKHDGEENAVFKNYIEAQHAYMEAMEIIEKEGSDVILNFSTHPCPLFRGRFMNLPIVTVFNSKPAPAMQSAVKLNQHQNMYYLSSSYYLQRQWSPHSQICEVIPMGIDLDEYAFSKITEENRAIWMGDIKRGTGLEDALQACRQNKWNLCIAGTVKDREYFEYIIKPYLNEQTFFLDSQKDQLKIENYLKSSEVALFTHETEGTSKDILKALATGVPVAAYPSVESIAEMLPSNVGKIAPKMDVGALAYAGKITLGKSREDCRKFVENQFNLKPQAIHFKCFAERIVMQNKENNKMMGKKSMV